MPIDFASADLHLLARLREFRSSRCNVLPLATRLARPRRVSSLSRPGAGLAGAIPNRMMVEALASAGSVTESDKARIDLLDLSAGGSRFMGMVDSTTLQVLLVVFVATVIRSTFGFGEALIAVPLLALTIPIEIVAPVAVLLSITIAAIVIVQDWRKIHLSSTGWLLAPTFPGIPLGIMLLTSIHQHLVKGVLAIVIVAFSGYALVGSKPPELRNDSRMWLLGCGFLAGVLGGAYGMNGPPLVIYGAMRRWSPQHFRATLQGYFLPASVVAMVGYWVAGLWVPAVSHYYLMSLPGALPAIFLGRFVNQRMRGDSFLAYVHGGLVCVGVVLLIQAIRRE